MNPQPENLQMHLASHPIGFNVGYNSTAANNNSLLITNGAKAVIGGTLAIARNGGTNNNIVIAGANSGIPALLDGGSQIVVIGLGQTGAPATGNWMRVDNGGVLTNVATLALGGVNNSALPGNFNNSLIVTNGGKCFCSAITIGWGNGSSSNGIIIADNGIVNLNNGPLGIANVIYCPGMTGNYVRVDQGGVLTNVNYATIGGGSNSCGNAINIVNGGKFYQASGNSTALGSVPGAVSNALNIANGGQYFGGNVTVGNYATSSNNIVTVVGGSATSLLSCATFTLGNVTSCYNTASVLAGGTCSLANNALTVGNSAGASYNSLIINGGQVVAASSATAASGTSNLFGNTIQVMNGGLLEANTLQVNALATGPVGGNSITNAGGIYQFSSVTPTINLLSNGMVYINGGTISFRGVTNADVFCNQSGKRLDSTNKMSWAGNNAFRLNNATNTVSTNQTYVFDPNLNATNFFRLELVSGATRYRGQVGNTLTIGTATGTGGQMLCSNTTALVDLAFTNNGTLTLVNSTLTLSNTAALNGTLTIDPLSQVQAGNLTLGPSSALILPVGATGTNVTLVACSGTLSGTFNTVSNLPSGYTVRLTKGSNGTVQLMKAFPGSVLLFK